MDEVGGQEAELGSGDARGGAQLLERLERVARLHQRPQLLGAVGGELGQQPMCMCDDDNGERRVELMSFLHAVLHDAPDETHSLSSRRRSRVWNCATISVGRRPPSPSLPAHEG